MRLEPLHTPSASGLFIRYQAPASKLRTLAIATNVPLDAEQCWPDLQDSHPARQCRQWMTSRTRIWRKIPDAEPPLRASAQPRSTDSTVWRRVSSVPSYDSLELRLGVTARLRTDDIRVMERCWGPWRRNFENGCVLVNPLSRLFTRRNSTPPVAS